MLGFLGANYLATGETAPRFGNDHVIVSPYGMFRTADGEVALAPSQEQSYQRLVDALEAGEWRDDPRFASNPLRVTNRAAMTELLEAKLAANTTEYRIEKLNAAGVPCGRVFGIGDVFEDPQVRDQQMVLEQDHPGHGTVRNARLSDEIHRSALPTTSPCPRNRRRHRRRPRGIRLLRRRDCRFTAASQKAPPRRRPGSIGQLGAVEKWTAAFAREVLWRAERANTRRRGDGRNSGSAGAR